MLGDDLTTAFLLGILLLWIGALICLRGSLFASQVERLPGTPASPASHRQATVNGDSEIDDLSILGISLVIVGYTIICYALLFWTLALGAAAVFAGFVVLPVIVAWWSR